MGALTDGLTAKHNSITEAMSLEDKVNTQIGQMCSALHNMMLPRKGTTMPAPRKEWKIWAGHCFQPPHHDKVYVVWIEDRGGQFAVVGAYGKRDGGPLTTQPKSKQPTPDLQVAISTMNSVKREKENKYVDVESGNYNVPASDRCTLQQLMTRIDTSRIVGYANPQMAVAPNGLPAVHIAKHKKEVQVGSGRVRRTLDI